MIVTDPETLKHIIQYIANAGRMVTSEEISLVFEIKESTVAWPNTRASIKNGMREYAVGAGLPIGATNRGFFLMTTEGEVYKYRDSLHGRIKGIEEKCRLAVDAWNVRCCS
jgi:hypothetical protein